MYIGIVKKIVLHHSTEVHVPYEVGIIIQFVLILAHWIIEAPLLYINFVL